jgi:mannose-6-phosphate isomerase-like protein (cupin superfamily)
MRHFNFSDVKRKPGATDHATYELVGRAAVVKRDSYSLTRIVMQGDDRAPTHYHRKTEEVYVILKGSAEMRVNNSRFTLTPGDVVVLDPGDVHDVELSDGETVEFLAISHPAFCQEDHINA